MFKPSSISLILLTGGLMAFGPLSTDMYIPSLPSLTEALGTTVSLVTLTLSVYLAGYAVGQLTYGPISDRYGRRPALLGGLVLFVVASAACVLAPNIESLIVARFFQAFGACSGQVVGRAVIRDLHTSEAVTRMLAYTMVIMGLTSTVSPSIGAFLSVWIGWQAIFALLTLFGIVMTVVVWRNLDESLAKPDPNATRAGAMLRNFARLLRTRAFAGYALSLCLIFAVLFTFLAGSSFVFIGVFGLSQQQFGLVFVAIGGTSVIGSVLTGRLAHRVAIPRMFGFASAGTAAAGIVLVLVALNGGGFVAHLVPLCAVTLGLGILIPAGFAGALAPHPEIAGTASSLIGFLQSSFAMVAGYLVGVLFNGTSLPMAALIGVFTVLSFVSFVVVVEPFRGRTGAPSDRAPRGASHPAE